MPFFVVFLVLLFSSFSNSQRKYFGLSGALTIKTSVINAVFLKAFNIWPVSEEIKNLLMVEADNIFQAAFLLNEVCGSLIRLFLGIYILWSVVGQSCFVGLLAIFLLLPLNVILEYCTLNFRQNRKREMIKLLSECLHRMKVLKLYAWEEIFMEKLLKLRKSERTILRKTSFLRMTLKFLDSSSTSIMALATISAYILIEDSINAKTLLLSFFIICILKTPFQNFFHDLHFLIEGIISGKKIQSFLETKELTRIPMLDHIEGSSLLLKNASFAWNEGGPNCLKNISLQIAKGSLIAVIGESGCGKSSLLRALLQEIPRVEGEASVERHIAFVTKNSWIQNTTVEKNILFYKTKDAYFYRKTLEACVLNADIDSFPEAEQTQIGQKGFQLSPAQKLKVDLARAVYQNADLYIFDEILTHLHIQLREHLYHRVIGGNGILKEKTRIFMTKCEEFLPYMDSIIFLKSGCILECGTYAELTEKNGHFSEYLRTSTTTSRHHEEEIKVWGSDCVYTSYDEPSISLQTLGSKLANYFNINGRCLSVAIILIAALAGFCEITSGVYLFKWAKDLNVVNVKKNVLPFVGFILSQILFTIICGIALFLTSDLTIGKLYTWLLNKIMRTSQLIYEISPIKKIVQSFEVDFDYVDERFSDTIYGWLLIVLKIPSFLVVIFMVSPFLAVLIVPLVYAFLLVQNLYLSSWQRLGHLATSTRHPLFNLVEDTLQGISHIRAANVTDHCLKRFHKKLDTLNNCFFLWQLVPRSFSYLLDITKSFLVLIIAISAFYNQRDSLIVLAILCGMQLGDILIAFVYAAPLVNTSLIHFERILSYFQLKQELEREEPANKPPESWPDSGCISVQNFSAASGMYPLLHNINLSIQSGQKVTVIGDGIETFFYSFFRFIEPLDGRILIDSIDIQKIGLRDLRSKLAVFPQETIIFKGSVRHNLDPGQQYTDYELKSALEKTGFKTSLETVVDKKISLEEKRLLSITRCLLKKPKLILLEEEEEDRKWRELFQESTLLSFCRQPPKHYNGRIIRFLNGEIVSDVLVEANLQT